MMANEVQISVLLDNRAADGLKAEHGLSLWIEADGLKLLLDTGQSGAFLHNAERLGIDVAAADALILSHGHYDHAGGVSALLEKTALPVVYTRAAALQTRYSIRNGVAKPNGMPADVSDRLGELSAPACHWVWQPIELSPRIGLTGPIPRMTAYEDSGGPFFLDADGKVADTITDDMAIWIETDGGLVVCTGCCHAGLINTLRWVQKLRPGLPVCMVIGGLHLVAASEDRMTQTISALRDMGVQKLVPLHCTGEAAVQQLHAAFGACVVTDAMGGSVLHS
jgi:7,8-dihydropterin-6-yl-methyl-4-(beta-D-ribofuranosyl)aminobenzene 5'-phosphate synthase